jgi:hypothetical protein
MKEANTIVQKIREMQKEIRELQDDEQINFVGCSEDYCEEKIDFLITTLRYFKQYLRQIEKN